jgi:hypothetical protein
MSAVIARIVALRSVRFGDRCLGTSTGNGKGRKDLGRPATVAQRSMSASTAFIEIRWTV